MRNLTATLVCLLLGAGAASAQQIGGVVTDTTGSVLPGVTVEARSPDSITPVRTTVTDGRGRYLVAALEPGAWSVTFSLPGHGPLVREGIALTTGFTARIDAQLAVGDRAATVTGASPVVDVRNNLRTAIIDREVIDSVPTGKSVQSYALLVPGTVAAQPFGTSLNQDAGGITAQTMGRLAIHGGRAEDGQTAINGLDVTTPRDSNATQRVGQISDDDAQLIPDGARELVSDGAMEAISVETAGHAADVELGGVRLNLIPREGGNDWSGALLGTFTGPGLQGENLDDDLRRRGVTSEQELDRAWLVNPAFGGPIVRDRLWFFAQHTAQAADSFTPGVFADRNPRALTYMPDMSKPVASEHRTRDTSLHLTWQASAQDKVKLYYAWADWNKPNALAGPLDALWVAPEASLASHYTAHTTQVGWVRPATDRLLLEAHFSTAPARFNVGPHENAVSNLPGVLNFSTFMPGVIEPSMFTVHRNNHALAQGSGWTDARNATSFRGSVTWAAGAHNLKAGVSGTRAADGRPEHFSNSNWTDIFLISQGGLLGTIATARYWLPNQAQYRGLYYGFYVQDQLTFDRLTVNAGLRWDRLGNSYPDQSRDPSTWEPDGRSITGNDSVVDWNDLQPRLGVAWDLQGNGKTALKASAHRYGTRSDMEWARRVNPLFTNRLETRFWVDGACLPSPTEPLGVSCAAADGMPQGDPTLPGPNGELLSPRGNPAFGVPQQTHFLDPGWSHGWGQRFSNWEVTAGVQQELTAGASLDVTYFRRHFVNFAVQDDRSLSAGDFDLATVDLSDRNVAGVGKVTFPRIKPEGLGRMPDVLFTAADALGGESRAYSGVDVTVNARLDRLLLQGGLSTGTTSSDFCPLYTNAPEHLAGRRELVAPTTTVAREFCAMSTPWLTQIRLLGAFTLPYDVQLAATLQSAPGPERQAIVVVGPQEVETALGRQQVDLDLAIVNALRPGTEYGERFNQLDLRLTKILAFGGARLRAAFDIYNLLNANAVFAEHYGVGRAYLRPTGFMPPRLYRFTFQYDF